MSARIKSSDFPELWSDPLKFDSDSEEEVESAFETTDELDPSDQRKSKNTNKSGGSLCWVLFESRNFGG